MKYNNILLAILVCFFKMQSSTAQTDSVFIKNLNDSIFYHNKESLILYDTFFGGPIAYYHYDNGWKKDSAVYEKAGFTRYYHYVDGEEKIKYTYYHKSGISVLSHTETKNDNFAVFDRVAVINGDTIEQSDTVILYYPDSGTVNYYSNNITLEAFNEPRLSEIDTSENLMRIFIVKYEEDSILANVYTISNILRDSLQITKKIGGHLDLSLLISKTDMIKSYTYESVHKTVSNKNIRKILQEMTSLEYLPTNKILDNLIIEYRINGKYNILTFSDLLIYRYFSPEMRKTFKFIKNLITYLENSPFG